MSFEERLTAHRGRRHMRASTAMLIIGSSSYFGMLTGIVRSILVMRLIGPNDQGIRRIVDIFTKYLTNAHLGILHGTNKVMPIYLGQQDHEKVELVEDVGTTWTIGLTLLAAVGMALHGMSNPVGDRTKALAIVIGAGWLITQQTYTLYRTVIRTWGNFRALGIVGAIDTVTTFVFTLLGAWKYGVLGAMGGMLAAWMTSLLVLHRIAPLYIRVRIAPRVALQLALAGLPIAAYIFGDTLLRTVDGAIIGHFLGNYSMGLYSVAMQMGAYLFAIPEAAGFVLWPRILSAYGAADGDGAALRRQVVVPTLVAGSFMPILAGTAYILLPPMVWDVLPKYHLSVAATQVLAMASVFLALPMATNSLLIANNREATAVIIKLLGAGVSALGCLWLVHHQGTLEQLALAAGAGYAVSGLLSVLIVLPQYERSPLRVAGLYVSVLAPFVWSCAALALSFAFSGVFLVPDRISWRWAIVRVICFVLLMIPVLLYGNRRTRLLTELADMIKSWRPLPSEEEHETNA